MSCPREFAFGMAERALLLRNTGASAPERWEFGNDERLVDGILILYATSDARLEELLARQRAELGPGSRG